MLAENKKAFFDYEILETYEAGLELLGFEVKAIRAGRASLVGAFVVIRGGEAYILNMQVPPYQPGNTPADYEPARTRKLLLKKSEISELIGKTEKTGLTIVPLKLYNKHNRLKLEIGLARHKKAHDKRASIKKRDTEREIGHRLKR
ncbi:MAG: SsrA-binding protein SmpB [Candidatus Liptonbacteria bacterium]|nr:SsrA-binding protein SmpB [Candidatus Liptonbacteria bacterium]